MVLSRTVISPPEATIQVERVDLSPAWRTQIASALNLGRTLRAGEDRPRDPDHRDGRDGLIAGVAPEPPDPILSHGR